MEREKNLSDYQIWVLLFMFTLGDAIIFAPQGLIVEASNHAWISVICSTIFALPIVLLYVQMLEQAKGTPILHHLEMQIGKWVAKPIAAIYFIYTMMLCGFALWGIIDSLKTYLLVETPPEAIAVISLILVVYGLYKGIIPVARTAQMLFPIFVVFSVVFFIAVTSELKFENLFPIKGIKVKEIYNSSLNFLGFPYLETLPFLFLPLIKSTEKTKKIFITTILSTGVIFLLITLLIILVLSAPFAAHFVYPTYILAQKVNIGTYLQRLEVLMAMMWYFTEFFFFILNFFALHEIFIYLFSVKNSKVFIIPLALLVFVLSFILVPDTAFSIAFNSRIWAPFTIIIALLIPLFIFFSNKWKQSKARLEQ